MPLQIPPEARDATPGILGALVAIRYTQGPILMRSSMFLGGASMSYFGAAPISSAMGVMNGAGLVGFVLGLFGMAIASKVYEGIAGFPVADVSKAVIDWIRKKLGV